MNKPANWSKDNVVLVSCLVIIFVVFPATMYFWRTHPSFLQNPDLVLPENSEPPPLPAGTNAVDFTSTTVDGHDFTFRHAGPGIKVLDFWATWCGPCHMSIPALEDLSNKLKSHGVQVVGVSVDTDTAEQVQPTVKQLGMTYTVLVDPKDNVNTQLTYNAQALPSLYIIDGKGVVRWSYSGYWPDEEAYVSQIISNLQAGRPVGLQ